MPGIERTSVNKTRPHACPQGAHIWLLRAPVSVRARTCGGRGEEKRTWVNFKVSDHNVKEENWILGSGVLQVVVATPDEFAVGQPKPSKLQTPCSVFSPSVLS